MPLAQKSGPAPPEISNLIIRPKKFLQLCRIGIRSRVFYPCPKGYRITDGRYFNFVRLCSQTLGQPEYQNQKI